MEKVYVVRHRHLVEGVPIRQIAREMGIERNTVRRYLRGAEPGVGKPRGVPGTPVLDAVKPRVEAILEDSQHWTAGKQRLTAARLHELLRSEGHDVGYTLVKQLVREWKRQRKEVFVRSCTSRATSARWISSRCSSISAACGARRTCSCCA